MLKAIAVLGLVWGVYSGVSSGVSNLRDGMQNLQESRQAAIDEAMKY